MSAQLKLPIGISFDSSGNLYIADSGDYRVRELSNGTITTVAGNGFAGGSKGPPTSTSINVVGVAVAPSGAFYIVGDGSIVQKVADGTITTVAADGGPLSPSPLGPYFSGNGGYGPALNTIMIPQTLAVDPSGAVYIGDDALGASSPGLVWKVANGVIWPVAGGGLASGDGIPALAASLGYAPVLAVDGTGNLYLCEWNTNMVYKVANGLMTKVAGSFGGSIGENVPATSVSLNQPHGIVADSVGNVYIADSYNGRIRKIANGLISTVAGNQPTTNSPVPGAAVYGGSNGAAMTAHFLPCALALDSAGNLYVADVGNQVIAELTHGALTVVAGDGKAGYSGDNGPATTAELNLDVSHTELAVDSSGNIFINDRRRIREISAGTITTIAGNGSTGASADNVPATSVPLGLGPVGLAIDSSGRIYVGDPDDARVRVLIPSTAPCSVSITPGSAVVPASGGGVAVTVNTAPACPWVVAGLSEWIAAQTSSSGPGIATLNVSANPAQVRSAQVSIAGQAFTITQAGAGSTLPVIASASVAYGPPQIAQNTWIAINGSNLVPPDTPSGGVFWSNAPSFATGQMPTELSGVSVTVNGTPAYVWWFCSALTSPACASDQINVLTPLDATTGDVQIVVTSGTMSSPPFSVPLKTVSPSFLVFDEARHIVATHANSSLVGPTGLYPGLTTPAAAGETVSLFATGLGLPVASIVPGAATRSGTLPNTPVCTIGNSLAKVDSASLISPGLYQLNVVIPSAAPSGDIAVVCSLHGSGTPTAFITKR